MAAEALVVLEAAEQRAAVGKSLRLSNREQSRRRKLPVFFRPITAYQIF